MTSTNLSGSSENSYLTVFVDVAKNHLDYVVGRETASSSTRIPNRLEQVNQWLKTLIKENELDDPRCLRLVCEPTSGLQHKLLVAARQHGAEVHYVDAEKMAYARQITYGCRDKTDRRDPGAIANLYQLGRHWEVTEPELPRKSARVISDEYEEYRHQAARLRNKILGLIGYVFVDYPKDAQFTFSKSGRALAEEFGFCPQWILQVGQEQFNKRMKARVPKIHRSTLTDLWKAAKRSVMVSASDSPDPRQATLLRLYKLWESLETRKSEIKEQLSEYAVAFRRKGWLPPHLPPRISAWMVVRLVAVTGPLKGYASINQLYNYVGLKLDNRSSGTYTGQVKITKKGPPQARQLLYQMSMPLVSKDGWLQPMHRRHHANGEGSGKGIRAMTSVMRKLLQVLWAMHRSGNPFDPKRVSCCESQYQEQSNQ